jgi:hypothetical protein
LNGSPVSFNERYGGPLASILRLTTIRKSYWLMGECYLHDVYMEKGAPTEYMSII